MSLWLDMLGAEIAYVETPTYGTIRIARAGAKDAEPLLFQHGINGHLEAYAKNIVPLSKDFHVIAFDYVGHGLSTKKELEYTPMMLAEQLRELMDVLHIDSAHLSGESLGGWVSGHFAAKYPNRVRRLMLNTAGGLPVVSEKGRADLANLIALNRRNSDHVPTRESVRARMQWLMHPKNKELVEGELIDLRLGIMLRPDTRKVSPMINNIIERHDDYLIPLDAIVAPTLLLWTQDNPIHDLECARNAREQLANAELYVMKGDSAHWPQFEVPDEFNDVATRFFRTGRVS